MQPAAGRRLASDIEGEPEAALTGDSHRPGLHLHIITHGDGVEEGAGPWLTDGEETDRLSPAFVVPAPSDLLAFGGRSAAASAKRLFGKLFGEGEPVGVVHARGVPALRLVQLVEILSGRRKAVGGSDPFTRMLGSFLIANPCRAD